MPHTLWNAADRVSILGRFGQLSPAARPHWGSLNALRMITHVTDAVRAGLGELNVSPKNSPLKYWPINALTMFYLPWPKGAPTAPELLERTPQEWQTEIDALRAAIDRFAARDINGPWAPHAAFGNIGGAAWGRLMYRHMNHHLTQFGA